MLNTLLEQVVYQANELGFGQVDSSGQASDQSLIMAKKLVYKEDFECVIVPNSFKVKPSTASGVTRWAIDIIYSIRKISRL